jgi:hypothetical protein
MSDTGNAPGRRLQSADTGIVRRNPNGTATIAADSRGRHARCDCSRLASTRSASRSRKVPRIIRSAVKRVVGLPCHQELGRIGHAQQIAPAAFNRATNVASWEGTFPFRRQLPASQRKPATSMQLLMLIGTPCRRPSSLPVASNASARRASARASSARTCTYALRTGLSRSICPRCASINSSEENSRARMPSAISQAESSIRFVAFVFMLLDVWCRTFAS